MKKTLVATSVLVVLVLHFASPPSAQGGEFKPNPILICEQLELEMELYSNAWSLASDQVNACYACQKSRGTDFTNCTLAPPDENGSCRDYIIARANNLHAAQASYDAWLDAGCDRTWWF